MPKSEWIVKPGAFEPIVDAATLEASLKVHTERRFKKTEEEMLIDLRKILATKGRLSYSLIEKEPDVMSPRLYYKRFGRLSNAFKLVGYDHPSQFNRVDKRNHTKALREDLMRQIVAMFPNDVSIIRRGARWRSRLLLPKRRIVSVLICRTDAVWKNTRNWVVEPVQHERKFVTLLGRLDNTNRSILDLYVFPNIDRPKKFEISDAWLARGKRLSALSQFLDVVMCVRSNRSH
jgi:hypothetical protein